MAQNLPLKNPVKFANLLICFGVCVAKYLGDLLLSTTIIGDDFFPGDLSQSNIQLGGQVVALPSFLGSSTVETSGMGFFV